MTDAALCHKISENTLCTLECPYEHFSNFDKGSYGNYSVHMSSHLLLFMLHVVSDNF